MKREWVRGDALRTAFALGLVIKVGDEVKVSVKCRGAGDGESQDPRLFRRRHTDVTSGGPGMLAVRHPNFELYYIQPEDVLAWRPKQVKP